MIEPSPLSTETAAARVASVRAARMLAARVESMREARIQRQLADLDRATGVLDTDGGPPATPKERPAPLEIHAIHKGSSRWRRWSGFAALATALGGLLMLRARALPS